jgi:hypothetical protein
VILFTGILPLEVVHFLEDDCSVSGSAGMFCLLNCYCLLR